MLLKFLGHFWQFSDRLDFSLFFRYWQDRILHPHFRLFLLLRKLFIVPVNGIDPPQLLFDQHLLQFLICCLLLFLEEQLDFFVFFDLPGVFSTFVQVVGWNAHLFVCVEEVFSVITFLLGVLCDYIELIGAFRLCLFFQDPMVVLKTEYLRLEPLPESFACLLHCWQWYHTLRPQLVYLVLLYFLPPIYFWHIWYPFDLMLACERPCTLGVTVIWRWIGLSKAHQVESSFL